MAPEMMKMMKYDEKVDIFSFGIVLCEVGQDSSIAKCQQNPNFSDFFLSFRSLVECMPIPISYHEHLTLV